MFVLLTLAAALAPLLAPHNPLSQNLNLTLLPPFWAAGSDPSFPLGTDHFGRDTLSRLLYGAGVSLQAAGFSTVFALVVGVVAGLLAGYCGGKVDSLIMRVVDVFLAFPLILLALSLAAILGPNLRNLILVMAITGWMPYARVIRASVLALKTQEYIRAAIVSGCSERRIIFRHILPNVVAPALVLMSFGFARFILLESGLSFLGLGMPPPTPTWGRMLFEARDYMTIAPWGITMPGLAIMVTALSVNFLGDGLRDCLDPKLQHSG